MKLLLVDDDADLRAVTGFALQQAGFLVIGASTVPGAVEAFERERPDLVLLDINLPGGTGFDACRAIRRTSRVPIMMLTVRGEEEDLVRALELGADDYLTKPFSPRTLIARVRALLRRAGLESGGRTTAGELALDAEALTLGIGAERMVRLTRLEFRLLQLLLAHAGQPVPTDRLLAHVWGHKGGGDRQVLKQLVHRLRLKLGEGGDAVDRIETIPAVGYRLNTGLHTALDTNVNTGPLPRD
ncbi:MAG: transcriptional regulatory protein CseB [Gammaproteobacteria bacterium]|nr:MAG: DNA-binding response regulator [Pseudomonadota bacterium]MBC6944619.1 DNA-binding response regulator [Gammaproteobacteria bacterium]MCE7896194.1 DNA-binding response regulator [Gammaproteobacteria bacterium PRO8]MDL1881046.1 response regulator transcription factor [Gammaproteobacteria bacterium PRO2]MCL4777426.1 response regulator transcription factor [Gammaproteobacteria bacterium]